MIRIRGCCFLLGIFLFNAFAHGKSHTPPPSEFQIRSPYAVINGVRYAHPGQPVVVLFHGLTGNSRNWREIGYRLWRLGYDVWMPNARGHGKGHHRSVALDGRYDFDALAMDMDDITREIYHRTQAANLANGHDPRLFLEGFSMGGMLVDLHAGGLVRGADGQPAFDELRSEALRALRIKRIVLRGRPPNFKEMPRRTYWSSILMGQLLSLLFSQSDGLPAPGPDRAPTEPDRNGIVDYGRTYFFGFVQSYLQALIPHFLTLGTMNTRNFDQVEGELARLFEKGVSSVHPDLLFGDFARWIRSGRYESRNGLRYENLNHHFPVLFIAGDQDELAPADTIFEEAEQRQSVGKMVWMALVRYTSHVDLGMGQRAAALTVPLLDQYFRDPKNLGPVGSKIFLGKKVRNRCDLKLQIAEEEPLLLKAAM